MLWLRVVVYFQGAVKKGGLPSLVIELLFTSGGPEARPLLAHRYSLCPRSILALSYPLQPEDLQNVSPDRLAPHQLRHILPECSKVLGHLLPLEGVGLSPSCPGSLGLMALVTCRSQGRVDASHSDGRQQPQAAGPR